jgi:hypothetical protein
MSKEDRQIKELINEGLSIISQMKIRSDSYAGPNTNKLKEIVKNLYPLISDDYPLLRDILSKAETKLIENGIIKAICRGYCKQTLAVHKFE